jgi:hypothetical protein
MVGILMSRSNRSYIPWLKHDSATSGLLNASTSNPLSSKPILKAKEISISLSTSSILLFLFWLLIIFLRCQPSYLSLLLFIAADWETKCKCSSFIILIILGPNPSTMSFNDTFTNKQTKSCTCFRLCSEFRK